MHPVRPFFLGSVLKYIILTIISRTKKGPKIITEPPLKKTKPCWWWWCCWCWCCWCCCCWFWCYCLCFTTTVAVIVIIFTIHSFDVFNLNVLLINRTRSGPDGRSALGPRYIECRASALSICQTWSWQIQYTVRGTTFESDSMAFQHFTTHQLSG